MKEEVVRQKEDGGRIKVGKFVREAVVRRLSMNGEYVRADRWAEALALTAIPPHCEGALKGIQALCDYIWYRDSLDKIPDNILKSQDRCFPSEQIGFLP